MEMLRYPLGTCLLENICVSQTPRTTVDIEHLVNTLSASKVTVQRFKAYKCGLTDDALLIISDWLTKLPPGALPLVIHLSDNEFTVTGFSALLQAIDVQYALSPPRIPVWQ